MTTQFLKMVAIWKTKTQKLIYYLRQTNPRKMANFLLVELERRIKRTYMRGLPYYFFIDPCDVCNLNCPLCATGNGTRKGSGMLKFDDFELILDKIAPYAIEVSLHSWGEPLLNKQIFAMIEAVRKRQIYPVMSSNLNVHIDQLGDRLIDAGLEKLIVSLDGVSQEVYEQYRVGGNIDLVFTNLKSLIEAKQRRGKKHPLIEWQYIVFQHNEHELEIAHALAQELGVDRFRIEQTFFPPNTYTMETTSDQIAAEKKWYSIKKEYSQMSPANMRNNGFLYNEACFNLYRGMFITPKGNVNPCCFATETHHQFGNLREDDLATIWNNSQYQSSRALFGQKPTEHADTLCDSCFVFKRSFETKLTHQPERTQSMPITFYDAPPRSK